MDHFGNRRGNRMLATALPFSVSEFSNKRTGSISFRVSGTGAQAGRVRKNFPTQASAQTECDRLNADELRAVAEIPAMRAMPTRLSEAEITQVEAIKARAKGRWELAQILDAGLKDLEATHVRVEVAPLFVEWSESPANELTGRWRDEVESAVKRFLAAHPKLMTNDWTVPVTRAWLDSLGVKGQTKANLRNALHRFAVWLRERTGMKHNPAAGLWISRKRERVGQPVSYAAAEAAELLRQCQADAVCRPLLGWLALTLLCGLRPEGEAPALRWTQVNFEECEIILKGNKRGSRARIVPLKPAAIEFLRLAQKESPEAPGKFTRGLYRRLRRITSEALVARGAAALPSGQDINRHTYASMRAAEAVKLPELAKEMGNDVDTLYAHYVNPLPAREAEVFWAVRPEDRAPIA